MTVGPDVHQDRRARNYMPCGKTMDTCEEKQLLLPYVLCDPPLDLGEIVAIGHEDVVMGAIFCQLEA